MTRARLCETLAALMKPLDFPDDTTTLVETPSIAPERLNDAKPIAPFPLSLFDPAAMDRAAAAFRHMPKYALPPLSAAQLLSLMGHPWRGGGR